MKTPVTKRAVKRVANGPSVITMDHILDQYSKLIHHSAWGCKRRLPDHSILTEQDLFNEGVLEILKAQKHFSNKRGRISTFLTVVLRNRYGRIMRREWKRTSMIDHRISSYEIEKCNSNPSMKRVMRGVRPSAQALYQQEYRNHIIIMQ